MGHPPSGIRCKKRKSLENSRLLTECGRWDLNPHDTNVTRSLVLLVCQFRHFRMTALFRCPKSIILQASLNVNSYFYILYIFYIFCNIYIFRNPLKIPALSAGRKSSDFTYTLTECCYAMLFLAVSAREANPSLSLTAISANIFLLMSMLATLSPCMNLL